MLLSLRALARIKIIESIESSQISMRVAIASDDVIKTLETFAKAIGIIESSCRFFTEYQEEYPEVSSKPPGAPIEYIDRVMILIYNSGCYDYRGYRELSTQDGSGFNQLTLGEWPFRGCLKA